MERIDGQPIRQCRPRGMGGRARDARRGARGADRRARRDPRRRLASVSASATWRTTGDYLARQVDRWLAQLDSYGGRELPGRATIAEWLDAHRPAGPAEHAVPRRLQARQRAVRARRAAAAARGRRLGDGRDRRSARRPRVGAHLPPRTGGHDARSAWRRSPRFDVEHLPDRAELVERYASAIGPRHGRDRLVRRVRPLEAGRRARGQLREVPARPVRQADPRVLRRRRPTCCSRAPTEIIGRERTC